MNNLVQRQFDYDVFLSYSSRDKTRVFALAQRLDQEGVRVWVDKSFIRAGTQFLRVIDKGLSSSRRMVACWSRAYLKSECCMAETFTILSSDPSNANLRLIPVLLEDCELPDWFRQFNTVDYRQESEAAFQELLAACRQPSPETEVVQPLHVAEDRFLQVLLSQFSLHRRSKTSGAELCLRFDDSTPAIWNAQGKTYLRSRLDEGKRGRYQKKLDDFLLRGRRASYRFRDANFFFRYGSAGTLPVITFGGDKRRYYCLFYRDVYPIGWNIANGGCDNRAELLDPEIAMQRELREELLIADFRNHVRYVFAGDEKLTADHPAHSVALKLWQEHGVRDLKKVRTRKVRVDIQRGPDSISIQVGGAKPVRRDGFYLNINGEDFGIEVDRVARIRLPRSVTFFDGELEGSCLVNAPVGLFEVEAFHRKLAGGGESGEPSGFRPDFFFFNARRYDGRDIDRVLKTFKRHVRKFRTDKEMEDFETSIAEGAQYGLCPVTARIVERHLQSQT